jgi:glyoxylase-like metal-dependent hydrolase (beta-lactamase superfamily II)
MKGCSRVVGVCLVLTVVAMMMLSGVLQAAEKQSGSVTVYALKYGETKTLPNYAALWMSTRYMPEFETPNTFMYYWLIKTEKQNILVDVGVGPEVGKRMTNYVAPEAMLAKVGLKPADIDAIIITHGHWDHLEAMDFYKNAKVYIQRAAYRFTVEEGAEYAFFRRFGYPTRKDSFTLLTLLWDNRLKLLDGNADLFPGIKVIQVDGHFPGLQLVVVETKGKPIIMANDSMHFYANLEKDHPMGLYFGNLRDIVKAFETIRALNGIPIPGHDPKVLEQFKKIDAEVVQIYP